MAQIKLSEKIELILAILNQCKSDYSWYSSQLEAEENKENTIRHEIEGVGVNHRTPPGYKERARLATELQVALIARRAAKDLVAITKPMADFLATDISKSMVNQLQQQLGETRKAEARMVDRKFRKRLTDNTAPENPELKKNLDVLIREWKDTREKPRRKNA